MKTLLSFFVFAITVFAQSPAFQSIAQKRAFADHLFCKGEFLRAVDAYQELPQDDSIRFYIASAWFTLDLIDSAIALQRIINQPGLQELLNHQMAKRLFSSSQPEKINHQLQHTDSSGIAPNYIPVHCVSLFLNRQPIPQALVQQTPECFRTFLMKQNSAMQKALYNPWFAASLSVVLPGAGKMYTGNYEEGAFGLFVTGLFTYLTIENFHHDHRTRGWITGITASLFYGGTIYGSYASAVIAAANKQAAIREETLQYMIEQDYFLPPVHEVSPCK